ncbi:MAG TPA: hypothetical protein VGF99_17280 [Myxococcota bacterium]
MSQHHDQNEAAAEQPSTTLPIVALVFFVLFWPIGVVLSIVSFVKYNRFTGSKAKTLSIVALCVNIGLALPMCGVCGIVAAVAVPNYVKFQCRAKQAEAKGNLKSLYVAEEAHRGEFDRYNTDLAALQFTPRGEQRRYQYIVLSATNQAFSAEARGVGDMAGDVWTIDQNNNLQNVANSCSQ